MQKHSTLIAAALAAVVVLATSAHAIDKCKVKVDKKSGVLLVSASGVSGTLLWGSTEGAETVPFFNAETCVASGKASKCEIADPTTLAAKTPPSGCTLYLDDDGDPCSVWIAGCSPGERSPEVCVPNPSASPRFVDNGDGTVSDKTTCLMWEQKNASDGVQDYSNPRDVDNRYSWSVTGTAPDGGAFTDFLARVNGTLCSSTSCTGLGGHSDWRLPTIGELSGLPWSEFAPPTALQPDAAWYYFSASTWTLVPSDTWLVHTLYGDADNFISKTDPGCVRAVRAGS